MTQEQRLELLQRNERLIEAVKAKAERACPGEVDLIALTGSFHSGEFYEKSDLDLLIIVGSDEGYRVSKCFILGDVAHDIYCHSWQRMEQMAGYPDPHVLKLLDVGILYCRSEQVLQRYEALRRRLRETLRRPLDAGIIGKARGHLDAAVKELGEMCLADSPGGCRRHAADLLRDTECCLYMLNRAYIRHGIRGIPEEICALPLLPEGFAENYRALIEAQDTPALHALAGRLLQSVRLFLQGLEDACIQLPAADAAALTGSYEEIWSNWRNKVRRAAKEGDRYSMLMALDSCQAFYDELAGCCAIERIDLFDGLPAGDLQAAAERFDEAMERLRAYYDRAGLPVARYAQIDAFIADYLQ